ncbi:hypothetical protein U1Q18_043207 [Sarracenia purpurea var. burkii]
MDARSFRDFLKKIAQKAAFPSFREKIVMDSPSFREFLKKITQNAASPSFREEIVRQAAFNIGFKLGYAGVGLVFAVLESSSIFEVDGGLRVVIYDRYRVVIGETVREGTHFVVPWLQRHTIFDIRYTPRTFYIVTHTKDLLWVHLIVRVLSRPEVCQLSRIYQTLGPMYDEKVLSSIEDDVMKTVVAESKADELVIDTLRVLAFIGEKLISRAKNFNIVIDNVAIIHMSFGNEFENAVEGKLVEKQEVERSKSLVAKAEEEKRATIIWAQGESECAKLISDAISAYGMDFVELKGIEVLKEISSTLSKNFNVTYLPKESNISLELKLKLDK